MLSFTCAMRGETDRRNDVMARLRNAECGIANSSVDCVWLARIGAILIDPVTRLVLPVPIRIGKTRVSFDNMEVPIDHGDGHRDLME